MKNIRTFPPTSNSNCTLDWSNASSAASQDSPRTSTSPSSHLRTTRRSPSTQACTLSFSGSFHPFPPLRCSTRILHPGITPPELPSPVHQEHSTAPHPPTWNDFQQTSTSLDTSRSMFAEMLEGRGEGRGGTHSYGCGCKGIHLCMPRNLCN